MMMNSRSDPPRPTTASQWRCAACGGAHGPDRLCDGTLNYEWHVMPSNRIRVRAKRGEKQK